ncbi:MAG: hypothetical protein QOJ39_2397 [Candidatus Eremiobacteraeota bacterium]|nr:hypothetical protein [Candidatus Eremiobacteraeota bacterium]
MEPIANDATKARATAQRRPRRPTSVLAPKRRAFMLGNGDTVDAAHALAGAGHYEYGYRAVHRKRLADAPVTDDKSWYFAFDPPRRSGRASAGGAEMTPTHAMLQAILCDKRFVQCTVGGTLFSAELTDVVREKTWSPDVSRLHERRRPDVSARAVRASDLRLNGRALDIEVAVTGAARTYDRFDDLIEAGRACLELSVTRDASIEANPNALEASLRSSLLSGTIPARWLVAPDGARAALKPSHVVRRLLGNQRAQGRDDLARTQIELAAAQELLDAPEPLAEHEEFHDRAALARVEAEWEALLAFAERYDTEHDRDHDRTAVVRLVADVVAPALRDPRLRTRTQRRARIRAQLRALFAPKNSGLMRRVDALERAMFATMSDAAARRAEAGSRAAIAAAEIRRAEQHLWRVAMYHSRLDALERTGARELVFSPGTSIRAAIDFEYRRRFGPPLPGAESMLLVPAM